MARESLIDFTRYTYPRYLADPAHELIAAKLDEVIAGRVKRLIIVAPPQHGKSELASVRLPALWLARRPDDPVILTSYGASLAESKSRSVRDIVESLEFDELFPHVKLRSDSRAVQRWQLANARGGLLAAGVDGPVTGNGGLLGIIDDPLENWAEAQSATVRENVWNWYRSTFRTRIWEGGAIVLMMTRWHEDDLAGRLLREHPGEWELLWLPAISETQRERDANLHALGLPQGAPDPLSREAGEPLCPSRFSLPALHELRRDVGPMAWSAEYLGVPRPAEGAMFKSDWFQYFEPNEDEYWLRNRSGERIEVLASACTRICTVDLALSTKETADYTAIGTWAITPDKQLLLLNMQRVHLNGPDVVDLLRKTNDRYKPGHILIESSGFVSNIISSAKKSGLPIREVKPDKDKRTRAMPAAARMAGGDVYLREGAAWLDAFQTELLGFPFGAHDDMVDSFSYAALSLAQIRADSNPLKGFRL